MKTAELTGAALDWAVARAEWPDASINTSMGVPFLVFGRFNPSANWAQAGPIIEREGIGFYMGNRSKWWAQPPGEPWTHEGPTPLIAAMRCYVASKLGDDVELPPGL